MSDAMYPPRRSNEGSMMTDLLNSARLLSQPGQVVEVRAITNEGMASGYFDSPDTLAEKVAALDSVPGVQGIYVT